MAPPPPPRRRPTSVGTAAAGRPGAAPAAQVTGPSPAAPGPVLACTEGPAAGQVFELVEDEYVIGRSREATLSVPDNSVSRKHARVLRSGGGWAVEDLGSGNGTVVNGERIAAETYLYSGDTIKLGDTVLAFRDDSNATVARPAPSDVTVPPRPARGAAPRIGDATAPSVDTGLMASVPPRRAGGPPPRPEGRPRVMPRSATSVSPADGKRQKVILGAVGALLLLTAVLGLLARQGQRREQEALAAQQQAMEQRQGELAERLQAGKALVSQGKWAEAKARFEELTDAVQDFPDLQQTHKTYLDRAAKEVPNQAALDAAEKAISDNRLTDSEDALQRVSEDTSLYERVRELRTRQKTLQAAYLSDARNALQSGGQALDRARELTEAILKLDPDHRDARVVNENVMRAIAARDGRTFVPKAVPTGPGPAVSVVARYKDGDLTGAVAMADECAAKDKRCKELASLMRDAQSMFKRVESMETKELEKLLNTDRAVTGEGLSKMGRQAGTQAGTKFFKLASSSKAAGKYGEAASWAQKALDADPENAGARALMNDLRGKCKETYMLGYSLKDNQPEEALVQLKQAVSLCSSNEEYLGKAKRLVQVLEGQAPQ